MNELPPPLTYRPPASNWAAVALFASVGVLAASVYWMPPVPPDLSKALLVALLAAGPLLFAVMVGWYQLRACVRMDTLGLRWRGLGGWQEAAWSDVTDYYDRLLADGKARATVVTTAGPLHLEEGAAHLRACVEQRATTARARGWGVLGTRPEDVWPRTFCYDTRSNRAVPWLLAGLTAASLSMGAPAVLRAPGLAADLGWPLALAALGLALLVFSFLPLAMAAVVVPAMAETRRRRRESWTATPHALTWSDGTATVEVPWGEVEGFHIVPAGDRISARGRYVVATRRGALEFLSTLEGAALLKAIITRYSGYAPAWRGGAAVESLGGEAAQWSGGSLGVGQRVYHYRTRTNRALLWMLACVPLLCALMALLRACGLQPDQDAWSLTVRGSLAGVATLWAWWRYRAAQIRTDDAGITRIGPFGAQHIPWEKVRDYREGGAEAFTFGNVIAERGGIRFPLSIAGVDELRSEIVRRAVHIERGGNAAHSAGAKDATGAGRASLT